MAALPLTDEHWSGLPLLVCNMDPGLYRIDVQTPMLVIRDDPGTQVEVLSDNGEHAAFRQAPLRFDLFGAGLQMDAVSDRLATKSLVVALPPAWMPGDGAEAGGRIALRSRFQFADFALRRLVWRLTTHHRGGEPLGALYSHAVSRSIVGRMVGLQLAADARHPESVGLDDEARRLVEAIIDASLPRPPSVRSMAATLGMGQARFVRQFKVSFEATPHQYVQRRRLLRASELLRSTDAALSTVALETGFSSHAHFSTVFRAVTGMTPGDYRRARGAPASGPH